MMIASKRMYLVKYWIAVQKKKLNRNEQTNWARFRVHRSECTVRDQKKKTTTTT